MAEISICQFHNITELVRLEKFSKTIKSNCSAVLLRPPLTRVLKSYTHVAFKSLQGCGQWEFCLWARAGQQYLRRNSNFQSNPRLVQQMYF